MTSMAPQGLSLSLELSIQVLWIQELILYLSYDSLRKPTDMHRVRLLTWHKIRCTNSLNQTSAKYINNKIKTTSSWGSNDPS